MKKTLIVLLSVFAFSAFAQSSLNKKTDKLASEVEKKMIEWRRDFHEHPELSNREFKTAEKIADEFGIHVTRSQEYIQLRPFQQKKVRVMIYNRLMNTDII